MVYHDDDVQKKVGQSCLGEIWLYIQFKVLTSINQGINELIIADH